MLDQALADKNWTAATEQTGSFQALPPAVVLDIDETVLDNSVYQARLIANSEVYDEATWQLWCREASATAVPGALGFTRYAEAHGVTVFYVTNRRSAVEAPTRQNLEKLGFPLSSTPDTLYTRGEKEEWASSNKTPRRQEIASHYRILLMLGDNLEDFVHTDRSSSMARKQIVTQYDAWWGTRWIVFANPQYGSWEGALFDFDFSLSESEKLKRKRDKLETK